MSEWAVGTAELKVVRELGHADGEVGSDVIRCPEVFDIDAFAVNEWELRYPACVEACCADDYVDFVFNAISVHEAFLGDLFEVVGENVSVGCYKSLEVTGCRCWTSAAGVEVLRDDLFA